MHAPWLVLLLAFGLAAPAPRQATIAAASDLQFALTEIAERFARERGPRVSLVFGSSGTLAQQIQRGAPFDLFFSADEALVGRLRQAGLTRDHGTLYAIGRLALFAPHGSPLVPAAGLPGLRDLLDQGRVPRLAIANPDHAPYGQAARAALRRHQLWARLQPHLVLGDNVSQAAQFAASGDTVGGLIALSVAMAPGVRDRGTFALIPAGDHPPLRQRMVLLRRAGPVAEQFYRYLQEADARAVLERYGFQLPGQ